MIFNYRLKPVATSKPIRLTEISSDPHIGEQRTEIGDARVFQSSWTDVDMGDPAARR